MQLHKIEIARRQIEVAAELFFTGGDFLAVVTLAGAAEEILGALIQRRGEPAMVNHIIELDKVLTGGRSFHFVTKEVNRARNALKHANDPSEDNVAIADGEAIAMLGRAVANYVLLTNGNATPIMVRVHEHLQAMHPSTEPYLKLK